MLTYVMCVQFVIENGTQYLYHYHLSNDDLAHSAPMAALCLTSMEVGNYCEGIALLNILKSRTAIAKVHVKLHAHC